MQSFAAFHRLSEPISPRLQSRFARISVHTHSERGHLICLGVITGFGARWNTTTDFYLYEQFSVGEPLMVDTGRMPAPSRPLIMYIMALAPGQTPAGWRRQCTAAAHGVKFIRITDSVTRWMVSTVGATRSQSWRLGTIRCVYLEGECLGTRWNL